MNRINTRVVLATMVSCLALACASPVVGLECLDNHTRCGDACFDTRTDPLNCGGCDIACPAGAACVDSRCTSEPGGGEVPDAAPGTDAGTLSDASSGLDGSVPEPPIACSEVASDECVCQLGEIRCGRECFAAGSDPEHCGSCDVQCQATQLCYAGTCVDECEPTQLRCGRACVDADQDPTNCGACGLTCASGICRAGSCADSFPGHVVVVGHGFAADDVEAIGRLLGNAVLLVDGDPVRVLAYDEFSDEAVVARIDATIDAAAAAKGRSWTKVRGSSLSIPFLLAYAEVLLVYPQTLATDDSLNKDAESWGLAMRTFAARGGVIVVVEGGADRNSGTVNILAPSTLGPARRVLRTQEDLVVVAPADSIATTLPPKYSPTSGAFAFEPDSTSAVVRAGRDGPPVVLHTTVTQGVP